MSGTDGRREPGSGAWMRDNFVLYFVAAGAYGGSLTHWLHLARRYGQGGWSAWFLALCVDALAFQAAQERQVDLAWQRGKKGLVSFPVVVLIFSVLLTLAGQVGTAQHTAGGILLALLPGVVLLIAIAFIERRGAERVRQARADEAERQCAEEQELARQQERKAEERRRAEAERQRQEAAEQEARRQAERERQRLEREERRRQVEAQRLGQASPSQPPAVSEGVSPAVSPGGPGGLFAVPPSEAGANTPERLAMWQHWIHTIKAERRIPSGAELLTAGGCSSESSLGRRMSARWRLIEPAASLVRDLQAEAAGS